MGEKSITCIVCPQSCRINVRQTESGLMIEGHGCKRGYVHAEAEMTQPLRMLTSTVPIRNASLRMLPVISAEPIPKAKIGECLDMLSGIEMESPVQAGDIIVKNICGCNVDIVASRSLG